jgi:hypothetical protein
MLFDASAMRGGGTGCFSGMIISLDWSCLAGPKLRKLIGLDQRRLDG